MTTPPTTGDAASQTTERPWIALFDASAKQWVVAQGYPGGTRTVAFGLREKDARAIARDHNERDALLADRDNLRAVMLERNEAASQHYNVARLAEARVARLETALAAMLDVQSRRRHPLGQPDEGIAYDAAAAASLARAALAGKAGA